MIDLNTYGWNDKLSRQKQESVYSALSHGRIAIVHKTCYELVSEIGMVQCELTGNMLFGKSSFELPCTGDWVIFQPTDSGKGVIVDMLPRSKALYRKKSGTVADRQAIAAHLDKAFIVQSLDDNFNVRRTERFMVQVIEEGITPVIVLTKADLGYDEEFVRTSLQHLSDKVPIFFTSIRNAEQIDILRSYIGKGETVVFIGSSGVGKSSLVNALCEEEVFATSHISDSTGKGRHTSTRREMVLMKQSGVLIDTPGVREFGIVLDDASSLSSVLDIAELEGECRFANCTHINEPGCAVIAAVERGILDRGAYESYMKLRREAWHFSASEHEKRKRDKSFTRLVNTVKKNRF